MRIIVDANIVFSSILNTNGKIADLLINSQKHFSFISPNFLQEEIRKHYPRLSKISGMTAEQIQVAEYFVCKNIKFISEEQIKTIHWLSAEDLVSDIDPNDIHYVAFAKHFRCKLWSGDKALMNGLEKKGFQKFITTDDLFNLRATL